MGIEQGRFPIEEIETSDDKEYWGEVKKQSDEAEDPSEEARKVSREADKAL